MFTLIKFGCMLICIVLFISSCSSLSVYRYSSYDLHKSDNRRQVVFRNEIPACAMRQLLRLYPGADSIRWEKPSVTSWTASFKCGFAKTTINFNSKGDWNRIYNTYSSTPADIHKLVASEFSEYRIASVSSIVNYFDEKRVVYSVVVQKEQDCKVLEVCNGNISVFSDLVINL